MTALNQHENRLDPLLRLWLECIVVPAAPSFRALSASLDAQDWPELLELAQGHGVLPLLQEMPEIDRICREKSLDCQPIRAAFARCALLDRLHRELLLQLDQCLQNYDLPVLVVKGAALTLTHYRSTGLRPRVDTDLFIEAKNRGRLDLVMAELGFTAVPSNFSTLVLPERSYQKQVAGAYLQLDVHWSLSSRPFLGKKLPFSRLYSAGVAFAEAKLLRMPRAIDALLVAVVHRLGHHRDHERYIWLYDIYLLWSALDAPARAYALEKAKDQGLAEILSEALRTSALIFPFSEPLSLPPRQTDVAAQLLARERSALAFDLRHATWRERFLILWERIWAEPEYLRHRYNSSSAPIWVLQLRRWFS